MTVLHSFPFANANARSDVLALQRAGMLSLFCTTIAWRRDAALARVLPKWLRAELERRSFDGVEQRHIRTYPWREIIRQAARRLAAKVLIEKEKSWLSADGVMRDFDERVATCIWTDRCRASAVYAYEYAALRTFEAASSRGMRCFYELPTGYWRATLRLLREERERNPEWAPTMEGLRDSAEKHERKDAELKAADHVVVPSQFVKSTLAEYPSLSATVDVIPYGAPSPRAEQAVRRSSGKLKVLYVGNLTQQKGISYLFAAMRRVADAASLTIIGGKAGGACAALDVALKSHDWLGSIPHGQVLDAMARHDLLVLPSIVEGFGLVILEAMASGLPVIATPNSGGPDVIEEGLDGFVVPIRDPDAIARRVMELHGDCARLKFMGAAALRKAKSMSWDVRGENLTKLICTRLDGRDRSFALGPAL